MFKYCYHYLAQYKKKFYMYIIITSMLGISGITIPYITGIIIDIITKKNTNNDLYYWCVSYFVIQLIVIIIKYISSKLYIFIQSNTAYSMNIDLINHIQTFPIKEAEKLDSVYMSQRINNDSNALTSFVINLINEIITHLISILFSFFILFQISGEIAIIMLMLGVIFILMYLVLKGKVYLINFLLKEQQAKFFSELLMQLKDIKFIRRHSLKNIFHSKINSAFYIYLKNILKSQKFMYLYSSLESIISTLANTAVFIIGGLAVIKGKTTIGLFTISMSYFNYIMSSFKYFTNLGTNYQNNLVSYTRIQEIIIEKKQENAKIQLEEVMKISCDNLSFSRNDKKIISNFTYDFFKGKSYCIYGENGLGKTTLLDLLLGIYNDYDGCIKYNETNIKDVDLEYLRKYRISLFEQNIVLFPGSVQSNIELDSNYSLDKISDRIIYDFKSFKDINEDNTGVSGGEQQKIGILRMLSKEADVYLLDEPTSALDIGSKKILLNCISKLKKDKIVIIVSHDKEVIETCDIKILLNKNGV